MKTVGAFSSFSVDDPKKAKEFYNNVLGVKASEDEMGLNLDLPGGTKVFVYTKDDHKPATFTVLNLVVEDINAAVDDLVYKGVKFERYDNMPAPQDDRGVLRGLAAGMGPDIAWFKDPAGNIFALIQDK